MDKISQSESELISLRQKQELHRQQLKENRRQAILKRQKTRRLIALGKLIEEIIPDAANLTEAEIREILTMFFT